MISLAVEPEKLPEQLEMDNQKILWKSLPNNHYRDFQIYGETGGVAIRLLFCPALERFFQGYHIKAEKNIRSKNQINSELGDSFLFLYI